MVRTDGKSVLLAIWFSSLSASGFFKLCLHHAWYVLMMRHTSWFAHRVHEKMCVIWADVSFVHSLHLVCQVDDKLTHIKANGSWISVIRYLIQTIIYRNTSNIGIWRVREWSWVWFIMEWTPVNSTFVKSHIFLSNRRILASYVCVRFDKFFLTHSHVSHHEYTPRIPWTQLQWSDQVSDNPSCCPDYLHRCLGNL